VYVYVLARMHPRRPAAAISSPAASAHGHTLSAPADEVHGWDRDTSTGRGSAGGPCRWTVERRAALLPAAGGVGAHGVTAVAEGVVAVDPTSRCRLVTRALHEVPVDCPYESCRCAVSSHVSCFLGDAANIER
jgi:hypothetical protein